MKRTVLVGLLMITLAIVLAFSACGGGTTTTTQSSTPPTSTPPTTTVDKPTLAPIGALPHPEVDRITADDLKDKIKAGDDIVIVDLRVEDSYNKDHIAGSINIPTFPPGQALIDKLKTLPTDKLIVLLCAWDDDGEAASIAAGLPEYGYNLDNLVALRGGWEWWKELNAWNAQDYPIE